MLANLIDLSHNLQTIESDDSLPLCLIDDITSWMRFQFGAKIFNKILFNGIKSFTINNENNVSEISVMNALKSISDHSSQIIDQQKMQNTAKEIGNIATKCESNDKFNFVAMPNELLFHISSYLSLQESVQLQTINYILFTIFHKIPKYYTQQLNTANMSWLKSNNHNVINKCKSITDINFKCVESFDPIPNSLSMLSSFTELKSVTLSCDDFGNVENMRQLFHIIPYQTNLSQLSFKGCITDDTVHFTNYVQRQNLFSDYIQKYGCAVTSLCLHNYKLVLSRTLISILSYCRDLKELSLEHDGVIIEHNDLSPALFDQFMSYTNAHIDYVRIVNYYCYDSSFEDFIFGLMHNVKSFHLLYFCNFASRHFLANYMQSYCEANDHIFDVGTFGDNIMQNEKHWKMLFEKDIYYKNKDTLCKLEELCIDINLMNKFMLFWMGLVVVNAENMRKVSLVFDSNSYYSAHIISFMELCLKKLEFLKLGIMTGEIFQLFVNVFKSDYKYYPIFQKHNKNNIKYIELVLSLGNRVTDTNGFNVRKELVTLMKLMSVHEISWQIGIKFENGIDEELRDEILFNVLGRDWPNYDSRNPNQNHFQMINYVDDRDRIIGKPQLNVGIVRNYDNNRFKKCENCSL